MIKPVAIIGLSFRFPSTTQDQYWDDLLQGKDLVSTVDPTRWTQSAFLHPEKKHPGTAYTFAAGSIGDIKHFDAGFFGISPREAAQMDPQQRLLLELGWEAIEHSGITAAKLKGSDTAVFIGIASADYSYRMADDFNMIDSAVATGNTASIAANRLSYVFDLKGPSMAIDTACSSSLVAFHQAVRAIQSGDCQMALTGGVSLHLHPYGFVIFSKASMLSPKGRCRVFDANGDGYVRSEGGGLFLLKDYAQAVADGDQILAVVANTAINTDGKKTGLTIPSADAQASLLHRAYAQAGIAADDINYIEAHGTGTAVGDPIETQALAAAIGQHRSNGKLLPIGSVKSNLGHLEAASGAAGLVKAIYSLKHRVVPATVGITQLNPAIDFVGGQIQVVQQNLILPADGVLTIGVNSFGFGGSNAHVILQSPPRVSEPVPKSEIVPISQIPNGPWPLLLMVSAQQSTALQQTAASWASLLQKQPERLYDLCFKSIRRRDWLSQRALLQVSDAQTATQLLQKIAHATTPISSPNLVMAPALSRAKNQAQTKGMVLVYSGNGCQWFAMGRALLQDAVFVNTVRQIDQYFQPLSGYSLMQELAGELAEDRLEYTEFAQPALFALQVGLTAMLQHAGLKPAAVIGHSVGEVAAAWAAGCLTLSEATQVIFHRSRQQGLTKGRGQMTAASISPERAQQLLAHLQLSDLITLAGHNSSEGITLAGPPAALTQLEQYLTSQSIFCRRLALDYAFHSPAMDPIQLSVEAALTELRPQTGQIPFYSTVHGKQIDGASLNAHYWWLNIREPVLFHQALSQLLANGFNLFAELGGHPVLRSYITDSCRQIADSRYLPSLKRQQATPGQISELVLQLILAGAPTDWSGYFPIPGQPFTLPTYPWQRELCWLNPGAESLQQLFRPIVHPLLGHRTMQPDPQWSVELDSQVLPLLDEHQVGQATVFPGTGFVEMALAAAAQLQSTTATTPLLLELEDLEIQAPLLFEAGQSKKVLTTINPNDGQLQIRARALQSQEAMQLHAKGRLLLQPDPASVEAMPLIPSRPCDFDRMVQDKQTLALDLHYGDHYRLIHQGWVETNTVIGLYQYPTGVDPLLSDYLLHPGVLDSAFQLIIQLMPAAQLLQAEFTYIPTNIGRIRFQSKGGQPYMACLDLLKHSPFSILANVRIYNRDGQQLALIEQARFKRSRLRQSTQAISLLQQLWRLEPLANSASATQLQPRIDLPLLQAGLAKLGCVELAPIATNRLHQELDPLLHELIRRYLQRAMCQIENNSSGDLRDWLTDLELTTPQRANYIQRLLHSTQLDLTDIAVPADDGLDAAELWRALLAGYPEHFLLLQHIGRIGLHLPELLLQTQTPPNLLPAEHLLHDLVQARFGNEGYRILAQQFKCLLSEQLDALAIGHSLRVLEISQSQPIFVISDDLPDPARLSLHYQCPHFDFALEELQQQQIQVAFSTLLQADEPKSIQADLVILQLDFDRLTVANMAFDAALRQLKPNGALMILGYSGGLWQQFIFEHTGNDEHSQQEQLTDSRYWQQLLRQRGFNHQISPVFGAVESAYLLLANQDVTASEPEIQLTEQTVLPDHNPAQILLLSTQSVSPLLQQLSKTGGIHWQQLSTQQALATQLAERAPALSDYGMIWYLHDNKMTDQQLQLPANHVSESCMLLTELHQLLVALPQTPALWVIHYNSWDIAECTTDFSASAVWGLSRTLQNEYPAQVKRLDLSSKLSPTLQAEILMAELKAPVTESEVRFDGSAARWLPQIQPLPETKLSSDSNFKLDITVPGQLRNLFWQPCATLLPTKNQISVRVEATGLNFRDVMYAQGLLSDEAVENGFAGPTLGLEFSGVIDAVGEAVANYQVGDRVLGFGPASFSRQVLTQADAIAKIPPHISYAAAATIPSTFFTAYYALHYLGQLESGETIVIHGAAGGVGIAAIQIAHWCGATVIATASSELKHDFLRQLGVKHILDSRSLHFADDVLQLTNGIGVDMVLNSLAGEAINRNLRMLKPFGRFLELGKRDFYENTKIGLRPFRNNITYFGIDADQLMKHKPALTHRLFASMMRLFETEQLWPLPFDSFSATDIVAAFRYMQQARQIGKIVVEYPSQMPLPIQSIAMTYDPTAYYLISGGMAGFGLASARELVLQGARKLILLSRRGSNSPDAKQIIADFIAQGVTVHAPACDVTDATQLQQILQEILQPSVPLKGIIHAAAVIEDSLLQNVSPELMTRVMQAKVQGAWNLHQVTKDHSLDFFVLYSSATTLFGNPGQGAYVAANSWLEAFARWRQAQQLPATAVLWGAIDDAGFLARNQQIKDALQHRMGGQAISSATAFRQLSTLLGQQAGNTAVLELDFAALRRFLPSAADARYSALARLAGTHQQDAPQDQDFREQLTALPVIEAQQLLVQQLKHMVCGILRIQSDKISADASVYDLGLDSLMGVELVVAIEGRFGIRFPVMAITEHPTLTKLANRLYSMLLDESSGGTDNSDTLQQTIQNVAGQHGSALNSQDLAQLTEQVNNQPNKRMIIG